MSAQGRLNGQRLSPPAITGARLQARGSEGRGQIVLIEDDEDIGEVVSYSLRRAGFSVRVAQTGQAGFLAACRGADLVVLDLNLPDENGLDVCRRLRRRPGSKDTPILIASARGEQEDIDRGLEAGANDYLVKPFSVRDLVLKCKATMGRRDPGPSALSRKRLV